MTNTTTWITGISRGIGAAIARSRAANGDRIAGCWRRAGNGAELQRDLIGHGAPAAYVGAADIADPAALADWTDAAVAALGDPRIIIHNAAILGPRGRLEQVTDRQWQDVVNVNITGTFNVLRQTARIVPPAEPALWIWMTSSVGVRGRAGWGPYAASKSAVENLSETFADENQDRPWISVALNPGGTRTDMRALAYPDEDPTTLPEPDTIATAVNRLIRLWRDGALESGSRWNAREIGPAVGGNR